MKNETAERYEVLSRTLSTGQGKNDSNEPGQQTNESRPPPDGVKRYEQLACAAKAFIFTVIVKNGQAVCTIHYPGVFRVTGYTEKEYATQPLLWFNMILTADKSIVLRQIAQLLRGETPPPIKHRIRHKSGAIRWLRNTSVPVFDSQGELVAYDGLIVDITEIESADARQDRQIAELTSSLNMVKTLHSLLPMCCSCKRIRDDYGYWQRLEEFIEGHYTGIDFTHGLCPECTEKLYPQLSTAQTEKTAAVNSAQSK